MSHFRSVILALLALVLSACMPDPRARSIGHAYVGPESLPLRKELANRAEVAATLKHGARLELIVFRRRFVKVRTAEGVEGWVDSRNLLTDSQVDELRRLAEMASTLPSQGEATVFDVLNVHTLPNRQAPSPWQIFPGVNVEVLGHVVARRVSYRSPVTELAVQKPIARKPKRKKKSGGEEEPPAEVAPPPMPAGPPLPQDWQRLSLTGSPSADLLRDADEWTLVRLSNKQAGYVLTRNLLMTIPDVIARQANGHRIMAYFTLGEVKDAEETKPNWLWATSAGRLRDFEFDSYRIFAYNLRRHRYETVFWEKNVRGFYPIIRKEVEVADQSPPIKAPGFQVLTEDPDGSRWRRTYAFVNGRARMLAKEPAPKPEPPPAGGPILSTSLPSLPPPPEPMVNRVKELLKK